MTEELVTTRQYVDDLKLARANLVDHRRRLATGLAETFNRTRFETVKEMTSVQEVIAAIDVAILDEESSAMRGRQI